jgi:hypothetical protein
VLILVDYPPGTMPNEAQGCMDVAGMEEVLKEVAEVGKRFTKAQADFEKAQQAEIDASDAFDEARLKRKHAADALKALADELEAKLKITEGAADDQVGVASMCSSASNFSTSAGSKDPTKRIMDRDWEEGEESYYGYSGCSDGEWDGGVEGAGYFLFERAGSKLRRIPDSVRSGALARELEEDRKEELKRLRKAGESRVPVSMTCGCR